MSHSDCYDRTFEWGLLHVGEVVEDPHAAGRPEAWLALLGDHAAGVETVLDVGCADGSLARQLAARGLGRSFTLVDISGAAIDYVQAHPFPGLRDACCCSAFSMPFADRSFDLAILSNLVEHVSHPLDAVCEASRVARWVLIEVPLEDALLANLRAWWRKRREGLPRSVNGVGHLHAFSRRTFERMLAQWDLVRVVRAAQLLPATHESSAVKRRLGILGVRRYGALLTTTLICLVERLRGDDR